MFTSSSKRALKAEGAMTDFPASAASTSARAMGLSLLFFDRHVGSAAA
jgi:hypothetical protein